MLRDLLWACRWLSKNRLFTLAIVAILALGMGANTAIFSIVDAVLLRPSAVRGGRPAGPHRGEQREGKSQPDSHARLPDTAGEPTDLFEIRLPRTFATM